MGGILAFRDGILLGGALDLCGVPGEIGGLVLLRCGEVLKVGLALSQGGDGMGAEQTDAEQDGQQLFQNSSCLLSLEILGLLVELVRGLSPRWPPPKPKSMRTTSTETEARSTPSQSWPKVKLKPGT